MQPGSVVSRRVLHRVLSLVRAGLAHHWAGGALPLAPLVVHGSAGALATLLVRDVLPPHAFALAILSLSAALVALPLLGDLAPLLRADPAEEWIAAQPVTAREIRIARSVVAVTVVLCIAAAALLPAAALAPASMGLAQRAALFVWGLGQALAVAAALLALLSALGGRAEAALLGLQTLLFGAVVAGALVGLRHVPELAQVAQPGAGAAWLAAFPPSWFAAAVVGEPGRAALAALLAVALLTLAPSAPAPRAAGRGALDVLLEPLCALASRTWVRRDERATFELVRRALPLERDVVLRTYPLVGIPLAFLAAGARGAGPERDALLALLLFMPPVWLPILLVHVPASASHAGRWILDGAPLPTAALHAGARKAIAVRFLLPLYVALAGLAAWSGGLELALRLALPAALVSLLLLRTLYARCVHDLPLSRAPDDMLVEMDWTGSMLGIGVLQVGLAVLAWKLLATWPAALLACAALLLAEVWAGRPRSTRSSRAGTAPGA
jgi:hypothetical protein